MKDYAKENYVTIAPSVDAWEAHVNYKVLTDYAEYISGTVADFGCNHGACTILAARNSSIINIVGIDKNSTAIDAANRLLGSCGEPVAVKTKIKYRTALLDNTGLLSESIDCIIMMHTFEHIFPEDYQLLFDEMLRILKPDGTVIVTVPFEKAHNDPSHVAWFTLESLQDAFESGGFGMIKCERDDREQCGSCINLICRKYAQ